MLQVAEDTTNGLGAHLWKLANYVRERVKSGRKSGTIVEVGTMYVRAKVTNFTYGDQGGIGMTTSFENVEKPEWHFRHRLDFAEEAIHASSIFKDCIPAIAAEAASPDDARSVEFQLSRFVAGLMSKPVDTQSDENLVDYLSTFIADLHNSTMDIDVSVWLEGLWLSVPSLNASGIHLRQPEAKDFEYERSFDLQLSGLSDPWALGNPSAIASFHVRGTQTLDAQKEVGALLNALRLYRLGSVHSKKYEVRPKSVIRFGGTIGSSGGAHGPYKYELRSVDEESLSKFLNRMRPLVPSGYEEGGATLSPALIGFRRYSQAVIGQGDLQERITAGITCLEALFLKDRERADLSYRLSLRVATLLKLVGFRGLEIKKHVHDAYDIRSNYIHGGAGDPSTMQWADQLCRHILDYARIAVVIFLQLGGSMDKDDIVSRLDGGLLEEKRLEKLKSGLATLQLPGTPQVITPEPQP